MTRSRWRSNYPTSLSVLITGKPWSFWTRRMCLCRRARLTVSKTLAVSVFLRKLEYNQGIMFLTTNRVRDFDDGIQSRITLALAVTVNGAAKVDQKGLHQLAEKNLNGRQVGLSPSNIVKSVNADHWSIIDQKYDRRGSCVGRVSKHSGVHVSFGIDH